MAREVLTVVVDEQGARVVEGRIRKIGGAAGESEGRVSLLRRALGLLGGAAIVGGIIRLSDTFTDIQNRLKLVTAGTSELNTVTNRLLETANKTRSSFEATAQIYARTALVTKNMGITQNELIGFTESLNQATILSGASSREATNALIQLSQGMASNTLRGDELRSVLEQLPFVADVIARKFGATRGELRKLAEAGQITALSIIEAFKDARVEIDQRFSKTIPTVSQQWTVFKNQLIDSVAAFDANTGATRALVSALKFLGNNLGTILIVAQSLAAFMIGRLVFSINGARSAWISFSSALSANPINLVLAAASAAAVALANVYKQQQRVIENSKNLKNTSFLDPDTGLSRNLGFAALQKEAMRQKQLRERENAINRQDEAAAKLSRDEITKLTAAINPQVAALKKQSDAWDTLERAVTNGVISMERAREIYSKFNSENLKGLDIVKATSNELDRQIALQKLSVKERNREIALDKVRQEFIKTSSTRAEAEDKLAKVKARVIELVDLENKSTRSGTSNTNDATAALDSLLASIDPVFAAKIQLRDAQDVLTRSWSQGIITGSRFAEINQRVAESLKDQLAPVQAIIRSTENEIRLLNMSADAREKELAIKKIADEIRAAAPETPESTIREVSESQAARLAQAEVNDRLRASLDSTVLSLDSVAASQAAVAKTGDILQLAVSEGSITRERYNELLVAAVEKHDAILRPAEAEIKLLQQKNDLLSETFGLTGVDLALKETELSLRAKGHVLSETEREDLRAALVIQEALVKRKQASNDLESRRVQLLEAIKGPNAQLKEDMRILNDLARENPDHIDRINSMLDEMARRLGEGGPLDRALLLFRKMGEEAGTAAELFENALGTAVSRFGDLFADVLSGGEVDFQKFTQALLTDIAKLIIKFQFMKLIGLIGGSNLGGGAGNILTAALPGNEHGSEFKVGGSGGVDSQVVAFRATPGERVEVTPQGQQGTGHGRTRRSEQPETTITPNLSIINVVDPSMVTAALQSEDGKQAILNVIGDNPELVRRLNGR